MKRLKPSVLMFATLVVGHGVAVAAAAQVPPSNTNETTEASPPWETPIGLVLFTTQKIEDERYKVVNLTRIASAQIQSGDKKQALETLMQALEFVQKFEKTRSNASALESIASGLARAGDITQALNVSEQIKDARYKSFALSSIALALFDEGDVERAEKVALRIEDEDLKKFTSGKLSATPQATEKGRTWSLATLQQDLKTVKQIENTNYKVQQLRSMALAITKEGAKKEALMLLNEALAATQKIDNEKSKASALSNIAADMATVGDIKRAFALADQVEDATRKAAALEGIASAQARVGANEEALATLRQALEVVQEIDHPRYKATVLNVIALTLATEFVPENEHVDPDRHRRMKKAFHTMEKQLARQLVEATQGG